jgi:DNA-directed RNA polymerase specialized sigma24 family protein
VASEPSLPAEYRSYSPADLIQHCAEQMTRYRRRQRPYNPWYCYELFRRALAERSEAAWSAVYEQYHRLVRHWLGSITDATDILVNLAFARLWEKIDAEGFVDFTSLGKLLAFFRRCTWNIAIDARRQWKRNETRQAALEAIAMSPAANQDLAASAILERIAAKEIYQSAVERLNGQEERLVFQASFEWDMKPAEIAKRWPHLFADVDQVYRLKENLLRRLRRDDHLQALWSGGER